MMKKLRALLTGEKKVAAVKPVSGTFGADCRTPEQKAHDFIAANPQIERQIEANAKIAADYIRQAMQEVTPRSTAVEKGQVTPSMVAEAMAQETVLAQAYVRDMAAELGVPQEQFDKWVASAKEINARQERGSREILEDQLQKVEGMLRVTKRSRNHKELLARKIYLESLLQDS